MIDEPNRAHWAYELVAHKAGSEYGNKEDVAHIAQCEYIVEKWENEKLLIPKVVSFNDYIFDVFKSPRNIMQLDHSIHKMIEVTIDGWWIKYRCTKEAYEKSLIYCW